MPRVCIVEDQRHPSPGTLSRRLAELPGVIVRTVATVPAELDITEALVLSSIPSEPNTIPKDRILRFVEAGGGIVALHDSVYPYAYNRALVAACGIRNATGAMQLIIEPERQFMQINLARQRPSPAGRYLNH